MPPQSYGISRAVASTSLPDDILSCGLRVSRRLPDNLRVLLVRRSRPAVRPLHGFRLKGASPVTGFAKPPSDFGPLQSVTRGTRTNKWCLLSRGFLPLQRNPTDSSHRPRAFHARVMLRPFAYHAIRRFTPESISPMSFNRVRSWGSVPFRA